MKHMKRYHEGIEYLPRFKDGYMRDRASLSMRRCPGCSRCMMTDKRGWFWCRCGYEDHQDVSNLAGLAADGGVVERPYSPAGNTAHLFNAGR